MKETGWNKEDWRVSCGDAEAICGGTVAYLAGPMRGMPEENKEAFFSAEAFLHQEGVVVLNPARLPEGLPEKSYMPICVAMLEQADVIAILPGWGYSTGAQAEMFYAMRQGKKTVFLERAGTEKETEKEKQEKYPQ